MGGLKRKAIQLANNTLVVSLPAKWAKQNNIEKGAELDIDVKDNILIIGKGTTSSSEARKSKLDISGMNTTLVWNYLDAIYRAGYNEIEIYFPDQSLKDVKTGEMKKTMDIISRITDKLIGMEIISQSRNSCVIKEVTQMKGEEFGNVLNRIFLSLRAISSDVLEALKAGDQETLENLYMYSEINVNKLSDYCMRILNLQGLNDFRHSNLNYLMIFQLEEVGDIYAQIARQASIDSGKGIRKDILPFFEMANDALVLAHRFLLNPKKEYYISFHEQRNRMKKGIDSLKDPRDRAGAEIGFFLKAVLDKLMELNNAKVSASGAL